VVAKEKNRIAVENYLTLCKFKKEGRFKKKKTKIKGTKGVSSSKLQVKRKVNVKTSFSEGRKWGKTAENLGKGGERYMTSSVEKRSPDQICHSSLYFKGRSKRKRELAKQKDV